jgi:hypothetical protein
MIQLIVGRICITFIKGKAGSILDSFQREHNNHEGCTERSSMEQPYRSQNLVATFEFSRSNAKSAIEYHHPAHHQPRRIPLRCVD